MKPMLFRAGLAVCALLVLGSFFLWPVEGGGQPGFATSAVLLASEPGFEDGQENAQEDEDALPSMLDDGLGYGTPSLEPVSIDDAKGFNLGFYSDVGMYIDEQGRYVLDLLEQDYAYLTVFITDDGGRAVFDAEPEFAIEGNGVLLRPEEVGNQTKTDDSGSLDFAVIGGAMGLDTVTVRVGDSVGELLVNVISLRATGFPTPPVIDGGLPWSDLMAARISFNDTGMSVEFPDAVSNRANTQVKMSGFMMPLDPDIEQHHFLLTSNPPSCFFHIPGGPAGAVEVFAAEGIEASWNPVVLEGLLETVSTAEYGVIYRLKDARAIEI